MNPEDPSEDDELTDEEIEEILDSIEWYRPGLPLYRPGLL